MPAIPRQKNNTQANEYARCNIKPSDWRCPWCNVIVVGNGHSDTSSNPG